MTDTTDIRSIGDLPVQRAHQPATQAEHRARFFNSGNAFNIKLPDVPNAVFSDEPAKALAPETETGFISCDASEVLNCPAPATSPLLLAQYLKIRGDAQFSHTYLASGVVHYAISGSGTLTVGDETIQWSQGDVVLAPGGVEISYLSSGSDVVFWVVSNEPHLKFEGLQPPEVTNTLTGLVHYSHAEIRRQIELLYTVEQGADTAGIALIFSSDQQQNTRNILPTLTLAMNTLPPDGAQRAHRHNSVAVSLVIQGEECYSLIDGERKDWSPFATTITPPTSVHSHHNDGDNQALFLIVQDGGLYYHTRAMGFAFAD